MRLRFDIGEAAARETESNGQPARAGISRAIGNEGVRCPGREADDDRAAASLKMSGLGQGRRVFRGRERPLAYDPLRVLASMVLLVTLLGVADTLAAGVLERTRQLGALRALGVPRRRVARIVLVEGLLLGGLGLVLALMAGLALAAVWIKGTLPSVLGWTLDLHVPYRGVPLVGALTLAVCLIAAFLPARRAARLQPQVALRYE